MRPALRPGPGSTSGRWRRPRCGRRCWSHCARRCEIEREDVAQWAFEGTSMIRRILPRTSDLRGAARLAADATAGLTDLVESMHERIANVPGLSRQPLDGRIGGIG